MRLTRLYTRTGDDGTTRLADGVEVPKDSARVEAYGTVDELNAAIGCVRAAVPVPRIEEQLARIQNELFDLGADLATPRTTAATFPVPRLRPEQVAVIEAAIDELTGATGPLENFVLPAGGSAAAALHWARTVCRRAERATVRLAREETIGSVVVPYLNRLSDLLFAMARFENQERGVAESQWQPGDD